MTDTYEFLKAQKDAILAKQVPKNDEFLKAALEDIAYYKEELIDANNEITALKAELDAAEVAVKLTDERAEFEKHWAYVRGPKAAKKELVRHPEQPQTYVQDSANRHWVTWQARAVLAAQKAKS